MTSGLQPIFAGAPTPVMGVTGGPGINSGTASVDPGSGALVFHPQPANVVQVRGSTPGAFQVYEYFHTNTDFSRLSLNAQTGGPFQIAVETDPTTVIRDLDIITGGNLVINAAATTIQNNLTVTGSITSNNNLTVTGSSQLSGNTVIGGITTFQNTVSFITGFTVTMNGPYNYTNAAPIGVSNAAIFQNTVGAAGTASPLPSTPFGYMKWTLGGGAFVIPYYLAS